MAALCSVDLLVVDDFALEPMSREESKDIYQLFIEQHGTRVGRAHEQSRHRRGGFVCLMMYSLAQSAIDRFMNFWRTTW